MKPSVYAGLFFTTLGTLMYEILLPRIFSVTMFYHFAFVALSIAMFGMTIGAVIVYLRPARYTQARAHADLTISALLFAVTLVLSMYAYLKIPVWESGELGALPLVALSYVVISIPLVFSGITVAIALTRFPEALPRLYAVDLVGAAVGCIAIVFVLDWCDGPTAALAIAAIIASGACLFSLGAAGRRLRTLALTAAVGLLMATVAHRELALSGTPVMRIAHRAFSDLKRVYERWNSYSYVEVFEMPGNEVPAALLGWGMSPKTPPDLHVKQLGMSIDVKAGTAVTRFDGDAKTLEFLRYDITNAVHRIRRNADVCVIGVGGGRDILSSLYFGQRSVLGIELNENVLGAVTNEFGDYAGHLERRPGVRLVADEARSYLARSHDHFDVVQISLIDTFAATAAGAFVLAENSLYTAEAWDLFLDRLKADGVLTVSRYYFHRRPAEAYRMLALAVQALKEHGVRDFRKHLVLLKNQQSFLAGDAGIGTLLVSKAPFSAAELAELASYARELSFDLVLTPDQAKDDVLARIAGGKDLESFYDEYEVDVAPPTDDRPFFFQMLRVRDVLNPSVWDPGDVNWKNLKAVLVLVTLLVIVVVLTAACILVPLFFKGDRTAVRKGAPLIGYFGAIGFGFMFIEVAQIQRLSLFLGHPTYALSVALFTLLLGSGAGSFLAGEQLQRRGGDDEFRAFPALLVVLAAIGIATPLLIRTFHAAQMPGRIALSVFVLLPAGIVMGMPFPIGMKRGARRHSDLLPWFWGINGATSVCASVVAMVVALTNGIAAAYWVGVAFYVVAAALFVVGLSSARGISAPELS